MANLPLSVFITQRPAPIPMSFRQRMIRVGGAALVYVALLALAAYVLLRAWQGMQWQNFWFTFVYACLGLLLYAPWNLINAANWQRQRLLAELLWDDPLVMADCPMVVPQPVKLVVSGLPIEPVPVAEESNLFPSNDIVRLQCNGIPGTRGVILLNAISQYAPLPFILLVLDEKAFGLAARFAGAYDTVFIVLLSILMFAGVGGMWFRVTLLRRGKAIVMLTADHKGLHWGQAQHLLWGDIKRLMCQSNTRKKGRLSPGIAYRVESTSVTIQWHVANDASPPIKRSSEFLQQLIVSHTDVPLRNITAFSAAMRASRNDLRRLVARRRTKGQDVASLEAIAAQVYPPPAQQQLQRIRPFALISALLAPVLFLGILGARAQAAQGNYFAALPEQLLRETPLYQSGMRQSDGMWPVAAPTAGQAFGATYTKSGYQLHGDLAGAYQTAMMSRSFGDAAIAVTVTFTAPPTSTYSSGEAGIVVRADASGQHALIFAVDASDGYWFSQLCNLNRHDFISGCRLLVSDTNKLMYNAPQATTLHLMLVMHGDSFLFYIDGQLYGTYNDAARLVPATGRIGFYSGDSNQRVTFSDITIVPVRGQTPWDYI